MSLRDVREPLPGREPRDRGNRRSGVSGDGYKRVQDEGSNLPKEDTIDFQGAGVTATAGSGKTIVTIPGGGTFDIDALPAGTDVATTDLIAYSDAGTERKISVADFFSDADVQAQVTGAGAAGGGNPAATIPPPPQSSFAFFTGHVVDSASLLSYRYFRVNGNPFVASNSISGQTRYVCSLSGTLVGLSYFGQSDGQDVEILKNGAVAITVTMPISAAYSNGVPVKLRSIAAAAVTVVADDVLEMRLAADETGTVNGSFALQIRHDDEIEGGSIFTFSRHSRGNVVCDNTNSYLHLPAKMQIVSISHTVASPAAGITIPLLVGSDYFSMFGNTVDVLDLSSATGTQAVDPAIDIEKQSLVTFGNAIGGDPGRATFAIGMVSA